MAAIWIIAWVVFGFVAASIWEGKGGSYGAGFALGALLGIIGLIIVLVAQPSGTPRPLAPTMATKECPYCKTLIRRVASVCAHCQWESPAWILHEGHWWATDSAGVRSWLDEKRKPVGPGRTTDDTWVPDPLMDGHVPVSPWWIRDEAGQAAVRGSIGHLRSIEGATRCQAIANRRPPAPR